MVLLEFSMAPRGVGASSPSHVPPYQLTPMGTILEGEWAEVMGVVTDCLETLKADCPRVGIHIKVD
jgi:uncharacterized protein YqgV (UPF0045/DUF77 family)